MSMYDHLWGERYDRKLSCRRVVYVSGGASLLSLALAVLALRKAKRWMPITAVVLALAAAGPIIILVRADIFSSPEYRLT